MIITIEAPAMSRVSVERPVPGVGATVGEAVGVTVKVGATVGVLVGATVMVGAAVGTTTGAAADAKIEV